MKTTTKRIENLSALRWACRRGMLEMDLLFGQFLDNAYSSLDEPDKEVFLALLEESDQDLYAWIMGSMEPPEAKWKPLLKMIREYQPCSFN